MSEHTGGDSVVDVLEEAGVEVVFGIPSVHNLPIYDALRRRSRIRPSPSATSRPPPGPPTPTRGVTGRLGVFISSTGPGAANSMGGLLEAFVSGSPVLHLTGQIETRYLDAGRGFIHEVPDQPAMLKSLSKAVLRPSTADEIAITVAQRSAVPSRHQEARSPSSCPIDLQYARRSTTRAGAAPTAHSSRRGTEPPDDHQVAAAAELLSAARRPLVWAGGGVVSAGAEAEVATLVQRLGAGLITSPNARGILSEDEDSVLGNLPWEPAVRESVRQGRPPRRDRHALPGPEHRELEDAAARTRSCRSTWTLETGTELPGRRRHRRRCPRRRRRPPRASSRRPGRPWPSLHGRRR